MVLWFTCVFRRRTSYACCVSPFLIETLCHIPSITVNDVITQVFVYTYIQRHQAITMITDV